MFYCILYEPSGIDFITDNEGRITPRKDDRHAGMHPMYLRRTDPEYQF